MKFSIIIPTMWMSGRLSKLLFDLNESDYVSEIILIDNFSSSENRLSSYFLDSLNKLKIYDFGENIYVNPAWNIGVTLSKEEYVCLCNDDVNFDVNVLFSEVGINRNHMGIIGVNYNSYNEGGDGILRTGHHIGDGWGCVMFLNKCDYVYIPLGLKIWYGDLWLASKITPYNLFSKSRILSEISTTADSNINNINEVIEQDKLNWKKINLY